MIEAARGAEARRQAELENAGELAGTGREKNETASSPANGKNGSKQASIKKRHAAAGEEVKTAQVLKKAAEAARAKKDFPEPAENSPTVPREKANAGPKQKQTAERAVRSRHLTTQQVRALRVDEAMRNLKSLKTETPQSERTVHSRQRLEEMVQKMSLTSPQSPLLTVALTHPSYTFENPALNKENNQRLEFLGDAVLDFIVGEYLYLTYPEKSEGELTKIRAAVVNEHTLAREAHTISLGQALLLGRGEQVSGGRERASILADALEAVIGAVYLQEGYETARRFVLDMLIPEIEAVDQGHYGDFKTLLQEVAQRDDCSVSYRILDEAGPDHDKSFTAGVFVQGKLKGRGTGKTKKEAEQLAARLALESWEGKEP